jgi:hypothetical protein
MIICLYGLDTTSSFNCEVRAFYNCIGTLALIGHDPKLQNLFQYVSSFFDAGQSLKKELSGTVPFCFLDLWVYS